MMRRGLLLLACCAGLTAALARAEPRPAVAAAPPIPARLRSPQLAAPDLPLLKLGLAVAAVGALGWAVSSWSRRRGNSRSEGGSRIEILARRGLGPRGQLALVSVAGRRLLVGMGGDPIRLIADLSDAEGFDATLERAIPGSHAATTDSLKGAPLAHSVPELVGSIGSFEGLDG